MKDFRTLKFLDWFSWLFARLGVDYLIMRRILQVKLMMDQRRVPTVFQQSTKKKQGNENNYFLKSLWVYVLFGVLMIPFMILGKNYIFQTSIIFGILMFLIMTSMISDFSSVLLDIRDKIILSTKPVDPKTISMAKTIHVCIYLFFLTGALAIPSLIAGLIKHGVVFTILYFAGLVLMDMFVVVVTALIYFIILKYFDGEKLKDIINYVQIGLSIIIAVGYQFVGRSFQILAMEVEFIPSWWQILIPPIWLGAPFEMVLNHNFNYFYIALSLLAITVPILLIISYGRMMPTFETYLQRLSNHSGKIRMKESAWQRFMMNRVCRTKEEKTFYRFANRMMSTEREFRLRVYPSLGFSLVIPFIFILNQLGISSYEEITASRWYLSIYFSSIVIPTAIIMIRYSGKYKGAWIYRTIPLQNPGSLYSGTVKAFLVNMYLPIYFSISIIFLFIFNLRIIPDLVAVFLSSILFAFICAKALLSSYPFSESYEDVQKDTGFRILPFMLLLGLFYGIHHFALQFPWGIWCYMLILAGINLLVWKNPFER